MAKRITYIRKPNNGGHEHITYCGNSNDGWEMGVQQIVRNIESGIDSFYVQDPVTGRTAWVGVVKPSGHEPYLRTYADGVWNDNLLSLPNLSSSLLGSFR